MEAPSPKPTAESSSSNDSPPVHRRRRSRSRSSSPRRKKHSPSSSSNRRYQDRRRSRSRSRERLHRSALSQLEPLDTYKVFMMHQDEHSSPEVYAKRYEEYKNKYEKRLRQAFFDDHKRELWLQERYSPAIRKRALEAKHAKMKKKAAEFVVKFKAQEIQFHLDEEVVEREMADEETALASSSTTATTSRYNNGLPPHDCLTYIRRVPCSCPEAALHEAVAQAGEYIDIYLTDPTKKKNMDFDRSGWVLYASPQKAKEASAKLQNAFLHDKEMPNPLRLQVAIHRSRRPIRIPSCLNTPSRLEFDLKQSLALAKSLDEATFRDADKDDSATGTGIGAVVDCFPDSFTIKNKLDTVVGYLRSVHFFVYYAGVQCIDMGDLLHTHPALMVRPPVSDKDVVEEAEKEGTAEKSWGTWAASLDAKIKEYMATLDPEKLKDERAKQKEIASQVETKEDALLESVYKTYSENVDESGKQRCTLCTKLFKASQFVRKHIRNKHPEVVSDKLTEAGESFMRAAFEEDCDRPLPSIEMNNDGPRGGYRSHGGGYYRGGNAAAGGNDRRFFGNGRDRGGRGGYAGRGRGRGGGGGGGGGGGRRSHFDRGYSRTPPPPSRDMIQDPRQVSTSYQDLDNLKDSKVELNFSAIGSLPPPKKKRKTE